MIDCRLNDNQINKRIDHKNNKQQEEILYRRIIAEMSETNPMDQIIANLIDYSQENNDLLEKYDQQFYLAYFDRNQIITAASYIDKISRSMTVDDFIRTFLLIIAHQHHQTIYLAISLKKLYHQILERSNQHHFIQFSDFTSYLCEKISKDDLDLVIPAKKIAKQKIHPDCSRVREIDVNPTLIINKVEKEIPKFSKELSKLNKLLEEKKVVSQYIYSEQSKMIIALGTLSSSIEIYDLTLKKIREIKPNCSKEMDKDMAILSMAYCKKMNRIGAIINNLGLVFWEGTDNYTIEKNISESKRMHGDRIHYLELFEEWITIDKNTIYFWDIKDEHITQTIKVKNCQLICDICQINHLRAIGISYVDDLGSKFLAIYHNKKQVALLDLGNGGCHTLHYNKFTQCLIPLGYHCDVKVYVIESLLFDIEFKMQLRGHKSLITCMDAIENTSLILTGDDIGEVRIWELNYMTCVQCIKVSKRVNKINFIGEHILFSDSRLNLIQAQGLFTNIINKHYQNFYGFYHFYSQSSLLWIITRRDARKINLQTGKIEKIYIICDDEEEISSAVQIHSGFVIGTSRGELCLFDDDGNKKWSKASQSNEINNLRYDSENKLLISMSLDNSIFFWETGNVMHESSTPLKEIHYKGNQQINLMECSPKHSIVLIASTEDHDISIWNYEIIKLLDVLSFTSKISTFLIHQDLQLIIVATTDQQVWILAFQKVQDKIIIMKIKQLKYTNSNGKDFVGFSVGIQTTSEISGEHELLAQTLLSMKKYVSQYEPLKQSILQNLKQRSLQQNVKSSMVQNLKRSKKDEAMNDLQVKNIGSRKQQCMLITCMKVIQLSKEQDQYKMIVGTNRGILQYYKFTNLSKTYRQNRHKLSAFHQHPCHLQYQVKQPKEKKSSVNMYRFSRQQYQTQFKNKVGYKIQLETMPEQTYNEQCDRFGCEKEWQEQIHKDAIVQIDSINLNKIYISTLSQDYYYKMMQVSNKPKVVGFQNVSHQQEQPSLKRVNSVNINYPLPIQWNLKIDKHQFVKNHFIQTVAIIDRILKNQGYQMLLKEYQAINISSFVEFIKKYQNTQVKSIKKEKLQELAISSEKLTLNHESLTQNMLYLQQQSLKSQKNPYKVHFVEKVNTQSTKKVAQILRDEYSRDDIVGQSKEKQQQNLKSLEAYKRVKLIKNIHQQGVESNTLTSQEHQKQKIKENYLEKENIMKLLSPTYFSNFTKESGTQIKSKVQQKQVSFPNILPFSLNLSSTKTNQNNESGCKTKPQEIKRDYFDRLSTRKSVMMASPHASNHKSMIFREKKYQRSMLEDGSNSKYKDIEEKPLKVMLQDLNSKLKMHKKNKHKFEELF